MHSFVDSFFLVTLFSEIHSCCIFIVHLLSLLYNIPLCGYSIICPHHHRVFKLFLNFGLKLSYCAVDNNTQDMEAA